MSKRQQARSFARAIRKGLEGKETDVLEFCARIAQPCPTPDRLKIIQLQRELRVARGGAEGLALEGAIDRLEKREHGAFEICLHKFVVHMGEKMGFKQQEIWASKLWLNTRSYHEEVTNPKGLPDVIDRPKTGGRHV